MNSTTVLPAFIPYKTRKSFARIPEVVGVPDLILIQHNSYNWFMSDGLKELFEEISVITSQVPLTLLSTYNPRWKYTYARIE